MVVRGHFGILLDRFRKLVDAFEWSSTRCAAIPRLNASSALRVFGSHARTARATNKAGMTRTLQRRDERLMSVDTAVTIGSNFMLIASGATLTIATTPRIKTGRNTVYSSGGVVVSISPLAFQPVSANSRPRQRFRRCRGRGRSGIRDRTAVVRFGRRAIRHNVRREVGIGARLNGSGKAPLAASREFFVDRGHRFMPLEGPLAAAIPGEALGLGADSRAIRYATAVEAAGASHRICRERVSLSARSWPGDSRF